MVGDFQEVGDLRTGLLDLIERYLRFAGLLFDELFHFYARADLASSSLMNAMNDMVPMDASDAIKVHWAVESAMVSYFVRFWTRNAADGYRKVLDRQIALQSTRNMKPTACAHGLSETLGERRKCPHEPGNSRIACTAHLVCFDIQTDTFSSI